MLMGWETQYTYGNNNIANNMTSIIIIKMQLLDWLILHLRDDKFSFSNGEKGLSNYSIWKISRFWVRAEFFWFEERGWTANKWGEGWGVRERASGVELELPWAGHCITALRWILYSKDLIKCPGLKRTEKNVSKSEIIPFPG